MPLNTKKIKPTGTTSRAPKPMLKTKTKLKRNPTLNMHKLHLNNGF